MPIGTVIVPAHNEARVIGPNLRAALAGFAPEELRVVVSCNGCSDGTPDVVRQLATELAAAEGPDLQILESATPSKVQALRVAEQAGGAAELPRVYLDADVRLPALALRAMLAELRPGGALAVRPPLAYDTSGASLLVRAYYRARSRVPSLLGALWGAGVYGVSATGRNRMGPWPDVLADDLHAHRSFGPGEIHILDCPPVTVSVPRSLEALVGTLARVHLANDQTRGDGEAGTFAGTLLGLASAGLRRPWTLPDIAVYVGVTAAARRRARKAGTFHWARDETTR